MAQQGPSRVVSDTITISPRPIRDIARDAVQRIDVAKSLLVEWGVGVPDDSRLHKARRVLADAVTDGRLVPLHRNDTLGLQALELSFDYAAIGDTLPQSPLTDMRRDLRNSLIGDMDPPEGIRSPLQLQSQAMVRAVFASSGVRPSHPTRSSRHGKRPDVVLENGTLRYAVEAKRPEKLHNLLPRFNDGVEQLRDFGLPGGIFVDLADCVRGKSLTEIESAIDQAGQDVIDAVFTSDNWWRKGYEQVVVAGVYARVAWSSEDHTDHAMVGVHSRARIAIFAQARGTLLDHRAKWIRSSFRDGLSALTDALQRNTPAGSGPQGSAT